ncbi:TetR/AcrR family transcriptional regulator [Nocardia panacis]|uniref:TetR/AcrR family transcriptional regulator n=1 Tax=Nocardia panacis TaxID=2340916 RepID=A0A3A4KV66_9NOCA|nr:TetR/AcrR family transcriptional regulator [Nocardia panacis]RJO73754.1 TetR/AcrR family transcriptional regulator [Nocardia panacis]
MGTRDDLLAAAKHSLAERGYARTTVRDIVAASQTNLAAINYHFRTRDALLSQAMLESTAEAMDRVLESASTTAESSPADRFDRLWSELIDSFGTDRELWAANIEVLAQALHTEDIRDELAAEQDEARTQLAARLFPDQEGAAAAGATVMTLVTGLLVQWMIDPDNAPTGATLAEGIATIAAVLHEK